MGLYEAKHDDPTAEDRWKPSAKVQPLSRYGTTDRVHTLNQAAAYRYLLWEEIQLVAYNLRQDACGSASSVATTSEGQ